MADSAPDPAPARKPLSMLWVLAAIGCFVVIHTVVNLAYRKPDRPHEPVAEARERQRKFVQGDMKGWTRYAVQLAPAANRIAVGEPASVVREPAPDNLAAVLPFELVGIFTTDPRLHSAPQGVHATSATTSDLGLKVLLRFQSTEKPAAFGEPLAFAKDRHLYLFLQDKTRTIPGESPTELLGDLEFSLPPKVLPAGDWQISLYTQDAMFFWQCTVRDGAEP